MESSSSEVISSSSITPGELLKDGELIIRSHVTKKSMAKIIERCGDNIGKVIRAASHYGRSSQEAVGLNDQTLLRVQRNGLKIANKI
jgi:hypothetical protein